MLLRCGTCAAWHVAYATNELRERHVLGHVSQAEAAKAAAKVKLKTAHLLMSAGPLSQNVKMLQHVFAER